MPVQSKRLQSELCQSEVQRGEAERKATQAAENMTRLTVINNQMEETERENENLNSQVLDIPSIKPIYVQNVT